MFSTGGQGGNGSMEEEDRDRTNSEKEIEPMSIVKTEVIRSNDSEEGAGEEPLIRIKNEEEGDDEVDNKIDFPMPEVHLGEGGVRKRKQDIQTNTDYLDDLQLQLSEEGYLSAECFRTGAEEPSQSKKDVFCPLYKLNPDDYSNDPARQVQIKRAKISYQHYEMKKWMISNQKKEIDQLRNHTNALMSKVLELKGCGCEKNRDVNIDVVDTVIPPFKVPGNLSRHDKWPSSPEKTVVAVKKPEDTKPLPLVNIHSSRLANLIVKKVETTTTTLSPVQQERNTSAPVYTRFMKPLDMGTTFGRAVYVKHHIPPPSAVSPPKYDPKSIRFLNSTIGNTDAVGRWILVPSYHPKPGAVPELDSLDKEIKKRQMEKIALEQKFKLLDGDSEEEELGSSATVSSPPQRQRNRKQTLKQHRMYQQKEIGKNGQLPQRKEEAKAVDINKIKKELEEQYAEVIFEFS